jgi:hypothetical protein
LYDWVEYAYLEIEKKKNLIINSFESVFLELKGERPRAVDEVALFDSLSGSGSSKEHLDNDLLHISRMLNALKISIICEYPLSKSIINFR